MMQVYTIDNRSTWPLYEVLRDVLTQADQVSIMVRELSLYGFEVLHLLLEKTRVRLLISQDLFTSHYSDYFN